MGTKIFYLVTLTFKFDLLFKNFNLGHIFLTRRGRAFIFHMCIPCSKTFRHCAMISDVLTSTLLVYLLKKIVLDYDFWMRGVTYCCFLHMVAAGELCCLSDNSSYICCSCFTMYKKLLLVNIRIMYHRTGISVRFNYIATILSDFICKAHWTYIYTEYKKFSTTRTCSEILLSKIIYQNKLIWLWESARYEVNHTNLNSVVKRRV